MGMRPFAPTGVAPPGERSTTKRKFPSPPSRLGTSQVKNSSGLLWLKCVMESSRDRSTEKCSGVCVEALQRLIQIARVGQAISRGIIKVEVRVDQKSTSTPLNRGK